MSSYSMPALDPDTGQYIELPIDQAQYLVQDNSVVQSGKSLIKQDYIHSGRNPRITGGRKSQMNQSASTMMSLGIAHPSNSQLIHSQALMNNTGLMNNSLSVDRMANAIAGTVSRGRPRGRRPLRGQFPVVPIDMVRQLGIEQQVILQPAAPVAMRNKSLLCRPLCMSRRTQANIITNDMECQVDLMDTSTGDEIEGITSSRNNAMAHSHTSTDVEMASADTQTTTNTEARRPTPIGSPTNTKNSPKVQYIPVPIPVPIYVPFPVATRVQPMPYMCPVPLPIPTPISLLLSGPEEAEKAAKFIHELGGSQSGGSNGQSPSRDPKSPTIGSKRLRNSNIPGTPSKKSKFPTIVLESGVDANHHLKFSYGINAWCHWTKQKAANTSDQVYEEIQSELVHMSPVQLNKCLTHFVTQVKKPNKEPYVADSIFYLCLGIQEYLNLNSPSPRNIFDARDFSTFAPALDKILANFQPRISNEGLLICRIEEAHLWEASQLGSEDPFSILFTVVYFMTKYFGLRTSQAHKSLTRASLKMDGADVVFGEEQVRLSPHQSCQVVVGGRQNVGQDRCPVSLIKKYLEKFSTHPQDSPFYGEILASAASEPVWYSSTSPFDGTHLEFMINRIKMVKEIQEAFMNNQHEMK